MGDDKQGQIEEPPAITGFEEYEFGDTGDSQLPQLQTTRLAKGTREKFGVQSFESLPDGKQRSTDGAQSLPQWWEDKANVEVKDGNDTANTGSGNGEAKPPAPALVPASREKSVEKSVETTDKSPRKVEKSVESSVETSKRSKSTTKTESDYPGYVDLNSCRLGDAIDSIISIPIIILQIIWITMEDQESTEGTIYYWTAAGMEIYLLIELWGYVLIGEVTPMSLLSLWLIRKFRDRYKFTFMPFPDVIRRISRFLLGLSLIANTALSFWPGVNDLIPLALSIQLWLALMASAGMNQ